jgi:DNA repair protein RecO (recombination protein O)
MLLKTRGIVLRAIKYSETSVIADILTEEKGLHTFIASGVRTAKSSMPYSLFQPMMVVEGIVYFKEDPGALHRLKELRAGLILKAIPFELKRGAVALFMAEICRKSIIEIEYDRELFEFIFQNIQWLDESPHPIANIHLHFLLHLSGYLGFQPVLESETDQDVYFDLKEGVFLSDPPSHRFFLPPQEAKKMLQLLQSTLQACHTVSMTRQERKYLLNNLLQFYQYHIPGFKDIHTPEILELVME